MKQQMKTRKVSLKGYECDSIIEMCNKYNINADEALSKGFIIVPDEQDSCLENTLRYEWIKKNQDLLRPRVQESIKCVLNKIAILDQDLKALMVLMSNNEEKEIV